mgnify:CR=1 FL=1|uniref:Uncharacterized protein n=1 Tax=candidate division CPR3 bacterium TaxID=2268181 RepID=A0A7C4QWZ2_UNCC3
MKVLIEFGEGESVNFLPDVSRAQIEDDRGNVIFCAVEEGGEMLWGSSKEIKQNDFKECLALVELRDGTITEICCSFSSMTFANEKSEKHPTEFVSTYFKEGNFLIENGFLAPRKRCLKKAKKQLGKIRHQKMACAH